MSARVVYERRIEARRATITLTATDARDVYVFVTRNYGRYVDRLVTAYEGSDWAAAQAEANRQLAANR